MEFSLSESLEDYLLEIYEVFLSGNPIRVNEIAKKKGVRLPSVVEALKELSSRGLLEYQKYAYIRFTDYGLEIARDLHERRKAILFFLVNVLHVDRKIAFMDAHKMEHGLSEETLKAIRNFIKERYGFNYGKEDTMLTVADLKVGEEGKVVEIRGEFPALKSKLLSMGVMSGTILKVENVAPLGDPIDVSLLGYHLSLRKEEAKQIIVEKI